MGNKQLYKFTSTVESLGHGKKLKIYVNDVHYCTCLTYSVNSLAMYFKIAIKTFYQRKDYKKLFNG